MIGSLRFRPARVDDVEILATIRRQAILNLATSMLGGDDAYSWANAAGPTRVQDAIDSHQVWVAEIAAQPVGWVEVSGNHIEGLYVRPERARQGLGSALLALAEAQIRSACFRVVVLDSSRNAELFYSKRGYYPLSERSPERGRLMGKLLD